MHNMTTNEQERLAYAEGYTETAAVLARLDDAHAALGDEVAMQAQLDDLQAERDGLRDELALERAAYAGLQAELDDVADERDDALAALDPLGCKLHDTRAELELTTDKMKTYRAALMALESEVSPGMRDFIREVLE